MPYLIRKALLLFSPTVDVKKKTEDASVAENEWNISFHEAMKTVEMNFKFGEEFTETLPMGSFQVNTIFTPENLIYKFPSLYAIYRDPKIRHHILIPDKRPHKL